MSRTPVAPPASTRRGRLPASERERRREQVVAAAREVLASQGFESFTMQAVATRSRASKETLYGWFKDRDGLLEAVIAAEADESSRVVADALSDAPMTHGQAASTLVTYAEALLRLLTGDVSVSLNRAAMTSPRVAEALLAAGRHRAGPQMERYLAGLHASGLSPHADPGDAFSLFFGLVVQDTQIRVLLGEQPPTADEVHARAVRAVDAFLSSH